jgi:hypothetical protein
MGRAAAERQHHIAGPETAASLIWLHRRTWLRAPEGAW